MYHAVEPYPCITLGFSWENEAMVNKLEMLERLTEELAVAKPCTIKQRDITERIIDVMPDAGKISAIKTLELLGKALLWVNSEYISPFARTILILQRYAVSENPAKTFSALENTLMVCYCRVLTKTFYNGGEVSIDCIAWQRKFFLAIVHTVETSPLLDPIVAASTLKLSGMIVEMNSQLQDIHLRVRHARYQLASGN